MEPRTVVDMLRQTSRDGHDRTGYLRKSGGQWVPVTWAEQQAAVRRIAKALVASGVGHGERVALLSQTRLEWLQVDLAVVSVGAVSVGIYPSSLAPDCATLLEISGAILLVAENGEQMRKILRVRGALPALREIVLLDGDPAGTAGVVSWRDFLARADRVDDATLEGRIAAIRPEDTAALVATSGTTGQPKLAMITHDNLVFTTGSILEAIPFGADYVTLLFLPLAHVFARAIAYVALRCGLTLAFAEDLAHVGENLREVRPHFIASVPRIFEKVHEKITHDVAEAGGAKQRIFRWAVATGLAVSRREQEKQPVPALLRLRCSIADRLVFHKIRDALGGRLLFAISGAAPLSRSIAEFFHACGILVLEGLGMTENTSFSNVNRQDDYVFGSVGPVGPGIEMKRAEDGEILFRGRNVMRGYFNNPEATAEALDADGWLHTGDVGEIDDRGFLRLTDRKKDLIITAGGKNVAPQRIERLLCASPLVSQAVVFGDRQKFISALLAVEPAAVEKWARDRGISMESSADLSRRPDLHTLLQGEVAKANEQLASFEQVKKFDVLPAELSIETGELTPTLKVKRKVVAEKYADMIGRMYAGDPEREPAA